MIRASTLMWFRKRRIPRESGDDPWDEFLLMAALLYSPRERG